MILKLFWFVSSLEIHMSPNPSVGERKAIAFYKLEIRSYDRCGHGWKIQFPSQENEFIPMKKQQHAN